MCQHIARASGLRGRCVKRHLWDCFFARVDKTRADRYRKIRYFYARVKLLFPPDPLSCLPFSSLGANLELMSLWDPQGRNFWKFSSCYYSSALKYEMIYLRLRELDLQPSHAATRRLILRPSKDKIPSLDNNWV